MLKIKGNVLIMKIVMDIKHNILISNYRTKVYSGNKSGYLTVPSLFEMCIQVLIENIDGKWHMNVKIGK